MKIIQCHNKGCRARVPINRAKYVNRQLWCSDRCAAGCNPPKPKFGFPFIVTFVQATYEAKVSKFQAQELGSGA
jgi:hypothetical protein